MNGGGDVESTLLMKVKCAWAKLKELSGLLNHRKVSLKLKDIMCTACIKSVVLYGSENWSLILNRWQGLIEQR